jgi:tight adherence protein C
MVYVGMCCAVLSTILLTYSFVMLVARLLQMSAPLSLSKNKNTSALSDPLSPMSLRAPNKSHVLWKISHVLGEPLQSFVTWGQRRRLSSLLARAGLHDWSFAQVYFFQCLFSGVYLVLSIWWLLPFLASWRVSAWIALLAFAGLGWWMPPLWLRRRHQLRLRCVSRQLPFFLDMVGLGLDAGLNLQASVQLALEHVGQGALHQEWSKMLADMRAGQSRAQALRQLSQRLQLSSIRQLISSLIQGEAMGFSLGRIIQIYADQQRADRLMKAEKQALQAPVKMLFPMALCIFPCTFIVLGFPVVVQLLNLK